MVTLTVQISRAVRHAAVRRIASVQLPQVFIMLRLGEHSADLLEIIAGLARPRHDELVSAGVDTGYRVAYARVLWSRAIVSPIALSIDVPGRSASVFIIVWFSASHSALG